MLILVLLWYFFPLRCYFTVRTRTCKALLKTEENDSPAVGEAMETSPDRLPWRISPRQIVACYVGMQVDSVYAGCICARASDRSFIVCTR